MAQYTENADFQEFLGREFDLAAAHATIEELAEFAFGSLDAAIQAYETERKDKSEG